MIRKFAEREPILISFLKGIVSKSHCSPFLLAVIVEAIYHLKNTNLILPHCFLTNLVEIFISGSKTVTAINGKILPGASDTSYRKWVNENGREKNGVPYCDLDVYVDNIGKYIVKKYRVHSERNNSPTVVTAVINIELQQKKADAKNIQFIENLKPRYWQLNHFLFLIFLFLTVLSICFLVFLKTFSAVFINISSTLDIKFSSFLSRMRTMFALQ